MVLGRRVGQKLQEVFQVIASDIIQQLRRLYVSTSPQLRSFALRSASSSLETGVKLRQVMVKRASSQIKK
jgi:hypothetical protein